MIKSQNISFIKFEINKRYFFNRFRSKTKIIIKIISKINKYLDIKVKIKFKISI